MTSSFSTTSMPSSPSPMRAEWSVDPKPLATAIHTAMGQEHPLFESLTIWDLIVSYLEVNKLETHTFVSLCPANRDDTTLTLKKIQAVAQHRFSAPTQQAMWEDDSADHINLPLINEKLAFIDTEHSFSAPTQQTTDADMGRIMIHQPYGGVGRMQLAISYEVLREFEAAVRIMTQALKDDKGVSGVVAQRKF